MQIVENDYVVCFDVDDTLIRWIWDEQERLQHCNEMLEIDTTNRFQTMVLPYYEHIELLKRYKAKGKFIIVWSQSGYEWAKKVVETLNLTEYVDLVLTKPEKYVDDLNANEWMEHVYFGKKNDTTPHN